MGKKKWQNPAFFWSWRIAGFAREPILRSQRSQKRTVRMASEVGRCPPEVGSFRKTNRLRTRDFCDLPPKKLHDFWLQNSIRLNFYFAVSEWSHIGHDLYHALFSEASFSEIFGGYMVLGTNCGVENHCLQHSSWLVDRTSQLLANTRSEAALGATNDLKATCMMY